MKLSAPKKVIFFISLLLAVIGLLAGFGILAAASGKAFYLMTAAYVVLTAGVALKGV